MDQGSVAGHAGAQGTARRGGRQAGGPRTGATALVVSNHGGRQLDGAMSSIAGAAPDRSTPSAPRSRSCSTAAFAAAKT